MIKFLSKKRSGFTLVEMVVVVVIIAVIYSFAVPHFSRYNVRKKLQFDAEKVAKTIEVAKSETTTKRSQFKVEFDSSAQEFYYLAASDSGKGSRRDKLNRLDTSVSFSSVPSDITFRTNGSVENVSSDVVVTLQGGGGRSFIDVTVNYRTGRVTIGDIR